MAKVMFIYLVMSLGLGLLWSPYSVEAKPFFFKFFDVPQSVETTRTQPQTSIVSTFVLTDFLARKLEFLAGLLSNKGSVSYSVGFNKAAQVAATTQRTTITTTSRPISTTPVQTVFVPESTESLVKAPLVIAERTSIEGSQSVQTAVVLGGEQISATSTTTAPVTAASTTAGTTVSTTVGSTAGTTVGTTASTTVGTTAGTTVGTTAETSAKPAAIFAPTFASAFASTAAPAFAAISGPSFAATTAPSTIAVEASAVNSIFSPVNAATTEQPTLGLTFASSLTPLLALTAAAEPSPTTAPTSSVSTTLGRLLPSLAPTPASSTDNIIILSLFDQTSGSTSGTAKPSVTVVPLTAAQDTQKATVTGVFNVTDTSSQKPGYGYSDPNVLLFDASNEIDNEVQKPENPPELERLDLDIRT